MKVPQSRVIAQIAHDEDIRSARPANVPDRDMVVAEIDGLVNLGLLERHHIPEGWYVGNVTSYGNRTALHLFTDQ